MQHPGLTTLVHYPSPRDVVNCLFNMRHNSQLQVHDMNNVPIDTCLLIKYMQSITVVGKTHGRLLIVLYEVWKNFILNQ